MYSFFDDVDVRRLLVSDAGKGLICTTNPPAKFRKKTVFFLKLNPEKLTNENIGREVLAGDFSDDPLEHLSAVSQEVFLPLLCNPRNQDGWPEVITKEVVDNLHKFIANVYVTIGQMKGKTLLPLPPTETKEEKAGGARDKDRIHVLESAVVTWTRQIKNVLKLDPETVLKEGLNPGPLVEIDFWQEKAANLNSIHEQLSGDKVRKVVKALELAKSTYYPAFNRLCKEVAIGRVEANDNVKYLRTLKKYFDKLNMADDFPALVELFKHIFHTILLIWKHSKVCAPARPGGDGAGKGTAPSLRPLFSLAFHTPPCKTHKTHFPHLPDLPRPTPCAPAFLPRSTTTRPPGW